jgi:phage tail sheath protein FI
MYNDAGCLRRWLVANNVQKTGDYPGVYVEEISINAQPITGVSTSTTAFVGSANSGPVGEPVSITSVADFERCFGGLWIESRLGYAVRDFFLNGGRQAIVVRANQLDSTKLTTDDFIGTGNEAGSRGLFALKRADIFSLLCIPPYDQHGNVESAVIAAAAKLCEERRAFLLVDSPSGWTSADLAKNGLDALGTKSKNAAIFFPRLRALNPITNQLEEFAPSGAVAGIYARTDGQDGVWKAAAGTDAPFTGNPDLSVPLTDNDAAQLSSLGINCLRRLPAVGSVIWGARTLEGDDRFTSEWKYVAVRRLALFLEESIDRGTQWAIVEPNDEPLWARIRLSVDAFLLDLFQHGALQGQTLRDACFVKCDRTTMTQDDIDNGRLNILVGFAPLRPAEFVVIQLQKLLAN